MPQKSGFFDTTADDPRQYPAREFAEYFSRFVGNGVFAGGTRLKVAASGSDSNVSVAVGYGWINGYMYSVFDSPLVLPIAPATTQDRIDRIILRLNVSLPVRAIKAMVLQGNPAANPVPPTIVRSGDIYDLSLAQVRVKANTTVIAPEQVTDERLDNTVCGIVTALIQQADTTSIFNQFQAWLNTKTAEYQRQWADFLESVQDQGFATASYVNQKDAETLAAAKADATTKANAAETNAKNASLPRSGGEVRGKTSVVTTADTQNSWQGAGVEIRTENTGAGKSMPRIALHSNGAGVCKQVAGDHIRGGVSVLGEDGNSLTDFNCNVLRFNVDGQVKTSTELFQSGVDAKNGAVASLIAMGVQASTNDSWATINAKIRQIATGKKQAQAQITFNSSEFSNNAPATAPIPALGFTPTFVYMSITINAVNNSSGGGTGETNPITNRHDLNMYVSSTMYRASLSISGNQLILRFGEKYGSNATARLNSATVTAYFYE